MLILDVVGPATLQGCADKLNTVCQQGVCLHRCLNLCNFVIMTKCSIEVPLFYIYQRLVCRVLEIFFPMSVIWTFYPNIFNKNMKKTTCLFEFYYHKLFSTYIVKTSLLISLIFTVIGLISPNLTWFIVCIWISSVITRRVFIIFLYSCFCTKFSYRYILRSYSVHI